MVRYFYRGAQKVEMDSADRILVSRRLLEYAGIEKEVILSAFNDRIEIWAKEVFDQLMDDEPDDFPIWLKKYWVAVNNDWMIKMTNVCITNLF